MMGFPGTFPSTSLPSRCCINAKTYDAEKQCE